MEEPESTPARRRRGRGKTVVSLLSQRECGVRSLGTLEQLPDALFRKLNREHRKVPELVVSLGRQNVRGDMAALREALEKSSDLLSDRMSGWAHGDEYSNSSETREAFVAFGGARWLVSSLMVPVVADEARESGWRGTVPSPRAAWDIRKSSLLLLRDLCYSMPSLSEELCGQRKFIIFLFSLMRSQVTFDEAVGLAEEILAFRRDIFNLALVPDVAGILSSFSKRQMSFFCRVLALLVFEPEEPANEDGVKITSAADLLTARRQQAQSPAVKNTDRNHAVLLAMPDFLSRMVALVRVQAQPMSRWADEIIAHLPSANHSDLLHLLGVEDSDDWDEDPAASAGAAGGLDPHGSIKNLALLAHQVEVLFVLCTLLSGRRKAQVQDRLMQLSIIPALIQMFDRLDCGKPLPEPRQLDRIHGPGCECDPESAMRIQFLRLVHNLCDREYDHDHSKHALLSPAELASVEEFAVFDSLKQHVFLGASHPSSPAAQSCGDSALHRGTLTPVTNSAHDVDSARSEAARSVPNPALSACSHYQLADQGLWTPERDTAQRMAQAPGDHEDSARTASPECSREDGVENGAVSAGVVPAGLENLLSGGEGGDQGSVQLWGSSGNRRTGQTCINTRRIQPGEAWRGDAHEKGVASPCSSPGLISRILRVFMRETSDSTYRFWLASCVEAFLRGSDTRSQVLLARCGLLEHLVEGVLNPQCSGKLQTNFDLLGELIKCNPEVFTMFNALLDDEKYTKLMQVVVSNLVDSNVFFRSVIISLEFFATRVKELKALGCRYDLNKCRMRSFLQHNTLRLLRDLMTVITVEDVNQENICVLNTSLSLFILARSHGNLHHYLDALRSWEVENNRAGAVTSNFLSLLRFWLEYYLYRGKDCLALELSSSIHFSEWREIVHMLVHLLEEGAAGGVASRIRASQDALSVASTPPVAVS